MLLTLTTIALLAAGCSTHYQLAAPVADLSRSGVVEDAAQAAKLRRAATDGEIANLLDLDIRAKLPTTLAVAKIASRCHGYQPRLERITAEELQLWERSAGNVRGIHGVQPVSNLAAGTTGEPDLSLRTLRVAAARLHCELLLVYMQGDSEVENFNDAAVLYWTFAGLWLVPGTTLEHRTVCQAILVDCRTGVILGTATGDARQNALTTAAAVDIHRAKLASSVPAAALSDLREAVRPLLQQVSARALAAKGTPRDKRSYASP